MSAIYTMFSWEEGKFFNASKNAMGNQAKVLTSSKRQQMFVKKVSSNNIYCVVLWDFLLGSSPIKQLCFRYLFCPHMLIEYPSILLQPCNLLFRDFVVKIVCIVKLSIGSIRESGMLYFWDFRACISGK